MSRVLVCALLLLAGCASKEEVVQSGLEGGMLACDLLLADPSIPRTPAAEAFCKRMQQGCYEALP